MAKNKKKLLVRNNSFKIPQKNRQEELKTVGKEKSLTSKKANSKTI